MPNYLIKVHKMDGTSCDFSLSTDPRTFAVFINGCHGHVRGDDPYEYWEVEVEWVFREKAMRPVRRSCLAPGADMLKMLAHAETQPALPEKASEDVSALELMQEAGLPVSAYLRIWANRDAGVVNVDAVEVHLPDGRTLIFSGRRFYYT